jgi:hypothetical protein
MITQYTCPTHAELTLELHHAEHLEDASFLTCPVRGCGRVLKRGLDENLTSAIGNAAEFADNTTEPYDGRYAIQFVEELTRQGYQIVELP